MPTYALRAYALELAAQIAALEAGTVADATETTAGKARLAIQADVDAGVVDNEIVTPLTLATRLGVLLAGKSDTGHTHTIADTSGLQAALDAKANLGDTQPMIDMGGFPVFAYGNSYANNGNTGSGPTPGWFTAGQHYLTQFAAELEAGTVTSYAINGTRLVNVVDALRSDAATGTVGTGVNPLTGSFWPGTSTRQGLVVVDSFFNDIAHYPTMVSPVAPAAITTANTRYKDGCTGMLRTVLALASSESRVEQTAGTFTGTWINTASASPPSSGGSLASTSTVGAAVEFSVTPAQSGPLAGKVYVIVHKFSPEVGVGDMALINVQVDGGTATPYTPTPWEQYAGTAGAQIQAVADIITVTVPVDGAAHTVKLTHAGTAGQRMVVDAVLIPSATPNPIAVMGRETPPNVGYYNATQVGLWKQNAALLLPALKAVVAEFPNTFWVPSTITSGGLYSGDGIHPNDLGQAQQANDLIVAAEAIRARMRSRVLTSGSYTTL